MVQTATAWTYRRKDRLRNHRVVFMAMPIADNDLAAVFPTGLKLIYSYSVSSPSTAGKYVTQGTVVGGTITLTVTDHDASGIIYLTAYGI
jgi:hypothetical protein